MKLRLVKGEHYTYVITQESTIQKNPKEKAILTQTMNLKIRHDVIDKLINGNYLIEASILNFNMELKYNGTVSRYDSDTVNVMNKYYKSLDFLTQIKLSYEVSPVGVVSKLSGFEPINKKIKTDHQLSSLLRSFGNEQFLMELYNYVPVKSVGVGNKWTSTGILPDMMNLKYDIHYTFKQASAQSLKLNQEASLNFSTEAPVASGKTGLLKESGTQKGILLIDPKNSMRLSSNLDQQIEIIMVDQNKPKGEKTSPIKITTNTKMLLVKNKR